MSRRPSSRMPGYEWSEMDARLSQDATFLRDRRVVLVRRSGALRKIGDDYGSDAGSYYVLGRNRVRAEFFNGSIGVRVAQEFATVAAAKRWLEKEISALAKRERWDER